MCPLMQPQPLLDSKAFSTLITRIRHLPRMRPHMYSQRPHLHKLFTTYTTFIGFISSMFSLMFFHVVFPGKRLVTIRTGEFLPFCFFAFNFNWRFFDFDFDGLFLRHFTTVLNCSEALTAEWNRKSMAVRSLALSKLWREQPGVTNTRTRVESRCRSAAMLCEAEKSGYDHKQMWGWVGCFSKGGIWNKDRFFLTENANLLGLHYDILDIFKHFRFRQ